MTTNLRAIETIYRGYRMRSRLEARWACFLDAVGVAWEYEGEGYELGGTRYLPDFFLPANRTFLEIKPRRGSGVDRKPAAAVEAAPHLFQGDGPDRHRMVVVYGDPLDGDSDDLSWWKYATEVDVSTGGMATVCRSCQAARFDRRYRSISATWSHRCGSAEVRLPSWQAFVTDAALAARQARFEHGESPALVSGIRHQFHDVQPSLYLAGRIGRGEHDWRDQVGAPRGDRSHKGVQFEMGGLIPTRYSSWTYAGPDLTVDHLEIRHGVGRDCLDLVRRSNSMFAWIDRSDVHGTMAEIGAWAALGAPYYASPLFVGFRSEKLRRAVWFADDLSTCAAVTPDAQQAFDAFNEWHEHWRCYQEIKA